MKKMLENLKVLDFSRFGAGPYSTALLADLGAEVIRVEDPGGGVDRTFGAIDPLGESMVYKATGRNKKGITLNLHSPQADEILRALLQKYDIVVHNIPPNTYTAKKLSYSNLNMMNPRVILGVVSGFGQSGPGAEWVSFDTIAQAMSGAMWIQGFPSSPPQVTAVRYVDYTSGAILAFSIMAAVYYRQLTGKGQIIDVALCDVAASHVQNIGAVMLYKIYGEVRRHVGNFGFGAYMDCCEAKDGWVYIAPVGDIQWKRFVKLLDREDMLSDERFQNDTARWENRLYIHDMLSQWVAERTVNDVVNILNNAKVAVNRVNTVAELMEDPTIKAHDMIVYLDHPGLGEIPIPGVVPKFSETPGRVESRAPKIGEHNEEIYGEILGFDKDYISRLCDEGTI
jgi:crotonobetainyl-CoA:carnitine CoA-transferase CaiB-like acyl-CoA transferase